MELQRSFLAAVFFAQNFRWFGINQQVPWDFDTAEMVLSSQQAPL